MTEDQIVSSDTWNTGGAYSFNKIFKNLDLFDSYLEVAKWGAESIEVAIGLDELYKNRSKIEALNRMVIVLRKIFDNSEFKIRREDKVKFKHLEKELDEVERLIGGISDTTYNQIMNVKSIKINEGHFKETFKSLRLIARELNVYINNAGFIFRTNEDLTKQSIYDRFVTG